MDNIGYALGILGSYFAIILVLSVAVETIIEPFTWIKGLRKKINPEELMKDLKDWVPENSKAMAKIEAITAATKSSHKRMKEIQTSLREMAAMAENAESLFGMNFEDKKKEILSAVYKYQYNLGEKKRIVILRVLSGVIGLAIAAPMQLDSFTLLSGLFPIGTINALSTPFGTIN